MGTRHWPEDADDEVERLECVISKLRTTITEQQARIAQLEEALKVARDALKELSPEETLGQHFSNNCSCAAINKINEVIGR